MRIHILAVTALATAFLAGCTGAGPEAPTAAPAATAASAATTATTDPQSTAATGEPSAAPGAAGRQSAATTEKPTDTALAEDTEAICAQASRTSSGFGKTLAENKQLLTRAEGPQEKAKAQEKVTRDLQSFSYALLDMSKLASDAEVKKALAAMGAQVTAFEGDVSRIDDRKLADLHGVLDKACGRG